MCKCTSFGHDDVRREIVAQEHALDPRGDAEAALDDARRLLVVPPGAQLLPALRLPGEYVDDQQSRFVNERMHANIQKDGTYSVVPRMWGGLTNPRELRAIADVVEKYNAPMVKVTGGQRLDIFGIKKEDLPAVWADLNAAGMVSGHAYGKSLRTVKTCVGSEWCRFGTQDSTGLGVKIERMTWGSWMPHKFKIAVCGCPRNCAEATIKDFGVICVDSGYELHVGGNGGIKVRATDLLCKVATEAGGDGLLRRLHPALPRGSALSRAHRAVDRARRARLHQGAARRRSGGGRDALPPRFRYLAAASCRTIPGRSAPRAPSASCTRTSPTVRPARAGDDAHDRRVARHRPGRRRSPGAARAPLPVDGRRGDRDVPHRATTRSSRWSTAARTSGGPLSQGIVHGDSVDLPAAQLAHLAADRRGAGRGQGLHADDPGARSTPAAFCLLRAAVVAARRPRRGRLSVTRRSAPPAPIAASAAASPRRVTGERAVEIAGDPEHPANRGKLCSKGTHLGETVGLEGRLLHPMIGEQARELGQGARSRRASASRDTIARARAGQRRLLRLGPAADRGLLRRQQADEGLHRHRPISTPIRGCACRARSPAHMRAFGEDVVPGQL